MFLIVGYCLNKFFFFKGLLFKNVISGINESVLLMIFKERREWNDYIKIVLIII